MLLQCSVTHPTFLTSLLFCHNGVLAIRHTNDCVSNPVISGTLRSVRPGGLYRYLRIVRFLEVSVIVQLHRYTHEIINNLSHRNCFRRCWLYNYFTVFFTICCIVILMKFDKLRSCDEILHFFTASIFMQTVEKPI